jgi:hypothetical protein
MRREEHNKAAFVAEAGPGVAPRKEQFLALRGNSNGAHKNDSPVASGIDSSAATPSVSETAAAVALPPSLYINRELSWLLFNKRVLEEAQDGRHPLLERVKFLAIFGSNLDEFFMIRVSGLQAQRAAGIADVAADGMTPTEALQAIADQVDALLREAHACWRDLLGLLGREGIEVRHYPDLRGR